MEGVDEALDDGLELQWCRCCGERRKGCVLLADAFRPEAFDNRFIHCDHICQLCHRFIGNLMCKIFTKATHDKVLRYWLAEEPISLPKDHIFVQDRMQAIQDSATPDQLRKTQKFVPYIPGLVAEYLSERWSSPDGKTEGKEGIKDIKDTIDAVILMADVTGYTALAETFCEQRGVNAGVEAVVTNCLNKYFSRLVDTIYEYGGDVVKFAGDAVLCIWKPQLSVTKKLANPAFAKQHKQQILESYAQAATLCAFKAKGLVERVQVGDGEKVLRLHCGLACGKVSVISVGGTGMSGKREIVLTGDTLRRAGDAVAHACAETVVIDHSLWRLVRTIAICSAVKKDATHSKIAKFFGEDAPISTDSAKPAKGRRAPPTRVPSIRLAKEQGYWHVKQLTVDIELDKLKYAGSGQQIQSTLPPIDLMMGVLESYIPSHVVRQMKGRQKIHNDVRLVSTLFLLISNENSTIGYETNAEQLDLLQDIFMMSQRIVTHHEGMIRQFIVDDKGCVLIVCFGVSTYRHKDDAARAIVTALDLQRSLSTIGTEKADDSSKININIGVTTGRAFCGPIGSRRNDDGSSQTCERREFSVVGNCVNLAARLMNVGYQRDESILCDETTAENVRLCTSQFKRGPTFERVDTVYVKGKKDPITLFKPTIPRAVEGKHHGSFLSFPSTPSLVSSSSSSCIVDGGFGNSISMSNSGACGSHEMHNSSTRIPTSPTSEMSTCFGRKQEKAFISHRLFAFTKGVLDPCILIQGEEGMGKSNLLEWTRQEIRNNYLYSSSIKVLGGSCNRSGSRVSYYGYGYSPLDGTFSNTATSGIAYDGLKGFLCDLFELAGNNMEKDQRTLTALIEKLQATVICLAEGLENIHGLDGDEDDSPMYSKDASTKKASPFLQKAKTAQNGASATSISSTPSLHGSSNQSHARVYSVNVSAVINTNDEETQRLMSETGRRKSLPNTKNFSFLAVSKPSHQQSGEPSGIVSYPNSWSEDQNLEQPDSDEEIEDGDAQENKVQELRNYLSNLYRSEEEEEEEQVVDVVHKPPGNRRVSNITAIETSSDEEEGDEEGDGRTLHRQAHLRQLSNDTRHSFMEADDDDEDSDAEDNVEGSGEGFGLSNQRLNRQVLRFRYDYPLIASKLDETTIRVFLSSQAQDLAQCIVHILSSTSPRSKRESMRMDTSFEEELNSNKKLNSTDALIAEIMCLIVMLALDQRSEKICVTVDDLEWLDELSMTLLRNIIGPQCPGVMVIATIRSSSVDRIQKRLGFKISGSPFIYPFELLPLNREAIVDLLRYTFEIQEWPNDIIKRVMSSCNGLPLWAIEYVRGMMANKYIKRDEMGEWTFDEDKGNMELVFSAGLEGAILQRFDNLKEEIWKQAFVWACVVESDFTVGIIRDLLIFSEIQDKLEELVKLRHIKPVTGLKTVDDDQFYAIWDDINTIHLEDDLQLVMKFVRNVRSPFTINDIVDAKLETVDTARYQQIIDELQRERFVVPSFNNALGGEAVYRVAHDYYYHAVYNQIPPGEVGKHHHLTAKCLSMKKYEFIEPLLAHHFRKAKDETNTIRCLHKAAKTHFQHDHFLQACGFLVEAVTLGECNRDINSEDFASMKLLLADMLLYLGRHDEAAVYLTQIEDMLVVGTVGGSSDPIEDALGSTSSLPYTSSSGSLRKMYQFASRRSPSPEPASPPRGGRSTPPARPRADTSGGSDTPKVKATRRNTTNALPSFTGAMSSFASGVGGRRGSFVLNSRKNSKKQSNDAIQGAKSRASSTSSLDGSDGESGAFVRGSPGMSRCASMDNRLGYSSVDDSGEEMEMEHTAPARVRRPSLKRMCSGSLFNLSFFGSKVAISKSTSFISKNMELIRSHALLISIAYFNMDHHLFIQRIKTFISIALDAGLTKDSVFVQFIAFVAYSVSPKYHKMKPTFTMEMADTLMEEISSIESMDHCFFIGVMYEICGLCSLSKAQLTTATEFLAKSYGHFKRSPLSKHNMYRKRHVEALLMMTDVALQRGSLIQAEKLCKEIGENYVRGSQSPQVSVWNDAWSAIIRFRRCGTLLTLQEVTSFEENAAAAAASTAAAATDLEAPSAIRVSLGSSASVGAMNVGDSGSLAESPFLFLKGGFTAASPPFAAEGESLMRADQALSAALRSWKIGDLNSPLYNRTDAVHHATKAWNILIDGGPQLSVWYIGLVYEILFYAISQIIHLHKPHKPGKRYSISFTQDSLRHLCKNFKSFADTFPSYKPIALRCKGLLSLFREKISQAAGHFRKASKVAAKLEMEYEEKFATFLLYRYCDATLSKGDLSKKRVSLQNSCGVNRMFPQAFDLTLSCWRTGIPALVGDLTGVLSLYKDTTSAKTSSSGAGARLSRRISASSRKASAGLPPTHKSSVGKLNRQASISLSHRASGTPAELKVAEANKPKPVSFKGRQSLSDGENNEYSTIRHRSSAD